MEKNKLKHIWANISGNTLLENMINHAGEIVYEDLKCFTDGESIEKYISDGTTIKSLLSNDNEMWQLLLYSGYLTKDKKTILTTSSTLLTTLTRVMTQQLRNS